MSKIIPGHIMAQILEMGPYFLDTELAEMFNMKFSTITSIMHRNKIVKDPIVIKKREEGRMKGAFKKGNVPFNKGQKMSEHVYEIAKKTMFKPGQLPHNTKPVGHERVCAKDGYVYIKVANKRAMMLKHRYVWEQHYGPIEKGMIVKFKDGNKTNCDIDNLYLSTRKDHMSANQKYYPTDIKSAQIIITKILKRINNAEKQD